MTFKSPVLAAILFLGSVAVAQAQAKHPGYLDATYRDARNHLAYLMK